MFAKLLTSLCVVALILAHTPLMAEGQPREGVKMIEEISAYTSEGEGNKETPKHENRLIHEKSPYLLQHANNPVDWYPWGEKAFEKAKREAKPIFLSIGYSTCHWCHVMERETFEDEEAAKLMNEVFVSIKVDREERPDIDNIYMTVCQMLTGGGGWPLSIIMTPDKKPFFAATYIPKENRFGRIGMMELTRRIHDMWATRRDEVAQSASKIVAALHQLPDDMTGEALGTDILDQAYEQLARRFDEKYGGFSESPKFPTPHNMLFLLRYWARTGNQKALDMVEKTLQAMRQGGIYDHVGFGFHRYSTDERWLLPHFEKMLYDQAMIAMTYIEAYQATGKKEYAETVQQIFTYVLRDMTSPEGGFYSAEDADSEGVEGKFYVWDWEELRKLLGDVDANLVRVVYNVKSEGNFKEEATGESTGVNILHMDKSLEAIARDSNIPLEMLQSQLDSIRKKLYAEREKRIHPHKDDKVLTDWNGLMIAALAKGARVLGKQDYADAARKAADFILASMQDSRGRLLHRYRKGDAAVSALVDDYAFFVWGLLELYETTFDVSYLQKAIALNQDMLTNFWDNQSGGFYFTADDGETLLVRKKEIYDGATPSGNSVASLNLIRLARISANTDLEKKANTVTSAFAGNVRQFPSAYTQLLMALEFGIGPAYEVVIVGDVGGNDTQTMLSKLQSTYVPNKVVILRPPGNDSSPISSIAEYTKYQTERDGKATAYVCRNFNCSMPTTDPDKMLELLETKKQ